jgi:hypothetical protein
LYSPHFGGGWLLEDGVSPPELEEDVPEEELPLPELLEDSEPPPELEEEGLPLPELLEAGVSSPPPPPSPPQALSVNAMASIKPAAIAGAKNLLPLLLSFVSIFFSFLGFNGLDYLII